jgi:exodeoxyribonuclease-3
MADRRRTPDQKEASLQRREAALAARPEMSPSGPAEGDRLRIATWNLNSLRTRVGGVERLLDRAAPDVLCLQETKVPQLAAATEAMFADRGYRVTHVGAGGYNGVAIASRRPVRESVTSGQFGDEHLDREPRVVACVVDTPEPVRVVSVYVPHGRVPGHEHFEYKLAFLDALAARAATWVGEGIGLVLAGDINVAPTNHDVFHPDAFVGLTHVTPEERQAMKRVLAAGLVDLDAALWGPNARRFTWWNYGIGYSRNLGMRIDMIAADAELAARLDTTWIDHVERAVEKPSDHAALIADFHPHRDVTPPPE